MPTPNKNETKQEFISRCIKQVSNEDDKQDWGQDRIQAYCYSLWKENSESTMRPRKDETREQFFKRCLEEMYDGWGDDPDVTDEEQRALAYCENQWDKYGSAEKSSIMILKEHLGTVN
jgi:hypothetical protein